MADGMRIDAIRIDAAEGLVALHAPNGHPVDPTPWLIIAAEHLDPGYDWVSDEIVHGPGWHALDVAELPTAQRLGDVLEVRDARANSTT